MSTSTNKPMTQLEISQHIQHFSRRLSFLLAQETHSKAECYEIDMIKHDLKKLVELLK